MKAPGAGFPRYSRLTKKKDYDKVLRHRSRVIRQGCMRAYVMNNALSTPRLGTIVGKRHYSRAVDRNRLKRLIRNSFRLSRSQLSSVDIVIQVFGGAEEKQLVTDLKTIWCRLSESQQPANP